jgi:glycerol uptake facilitator-like aquaporin
MNNDLLKYITEFLGTIILVFIGLITNGNWIAIGLCLAICVYLGGSISGGAYNPAIVISYLYINKINTFQFVCYLVFELLGALVACWLYNMLH